MTISSDDYGKFMRIEQNQWTSAGWSIVPRGNLSEKTQLVLLFGNSAALKQDTYLNDLRKAYPYAQIMGCSTAGEILDTQVVDDTVSVTAIEFAYTKVKGTVTTLTPGEDSFAIGDRLGQHLELEGLAHVFVLSDGLHVNGSDLVRGLTQHLPKNVNITGGLAGDGADFGETFVLWGEQLQSGAIAALGFYGDRLKVSYSSVGGWRPFGPERLITESHGNVLYKLDDKSALELYKTYLGEHAEGLPATGLLFPLSLRLPHEEYLVRTILSVNEADQSMTFAGDVPKGTIAQFMHATVDRLIDGAMTAAEQSLAPQIGAHPVSEADAEAGAGAVSEGAIEPELAILISCVGRKLLMKQRVEEEVEVVRQVLGDRPAITGFYSYGEIAPSEVGGAANLHNQTMTITTFAEV